MAYAPNEPPNEVELEVVRASEITPKEVRWLWYPYIPFGKVTLLQGDPGDGKSKLMLTLSAILSRAKPLPFSDESDAYEPMTVIYTFFQLKHFDVSIAMSALMAVTQLCDRKSRSMSNPASLRLAHTAKMPCDKNVL